MEPADRVPNAQPDSTRHLLQLHHVVREKDQHRSVVRIRLPPRVLSRVALRHIEPFDSMALAAVLLALMAIAVVGCLLPARRGALLNPLAALRAE